MTSAGPRRALSAAALLWSGSVLLSRVIGLVREAVVGRTLGAGGQADVLWSAFMLPDWLNYLLAGGAIGIVLIPLLARTTAQHGEAAMWALCGALARRIALIVAVIAGALWLACPWLLPWLLPGFSDEQLRTLTALTRVVLPAQWFHVVGGIYAAGLMSRDRHVAAALAPLLYTGSVIVGGLLGAALLGGPHAAPGFAWGTLVGSALGPFALPVWHARRLALVHAPPAAPDAHASSSSAQAATREYFARALPVMLAFSVIAADDWVLKWQASRLAEGSISTLQYAKTLLRVPIGVFGVALGAAAFPTLSRLVSEGDRAGAFALLRRAYAQVRVLATLSAAGLIAAGPEMVAVIYGDRVPADQRLQIGLALAIMALSLWAWAGQTVVARGYYADGDTWTPSVLGTLALIVGLPLYHWGAARWGVIGLAGASTVTVSAYVIALSLRLRPRYAGPVSALGSLVREWLALAIGATCGVALSRVLRTDASGVEALVRGAALGASAVAVALGVLWLTGHEQVQPLVSRIGDRIRRRVS